jgi:asparagine synthase (glutamine-hydrolysing)
MKWRDRFSGIFSRTSAGRLETLFGTGELAYHYYADSVAFGYLIRPDKAAQKFAISANGKVAVVADAHIYNQTELLAKLEPQYKPPTEHPTELILALYLQYGETFAKHIRGMFTTAIWDNRTANPTLILTRDAIGARTLYYAVVPDGLIFSSTLRSLRKWHSLPLEVNFSAVRKYLTTAFVPGEETLLQNCFELLPAHYLRVALDKDNQLMLKKAAYWRIQETEWDETAPVEAYSRPLRTLLEDCVQERLPQSGKVGILLSGGLDSSAVTALAAGLYNHADIHTYSISFGSQYPNELYFSSMVAEHCRTKHRMLEISGKEIAANLLETVARLDDPVGDPLTVPNFLLDHAAAQDTDIILNGEGGDPCFGGPKNLPMLLHEMYGDGGTTELAREQNYLRSYQKCYDDLPMLLTPRVHEALKQVEPMEAMVTPFFDERSGMSRYLNRLQLINVLLKGSHNILFKVDRTTASSGVEGRSPLFDKRIVEFSFTVPPHHKLLGTNEKYVLKKAVEDILPEPIITRPKSGMMVPVQGWFKREMKDIAKEHLLGKRISQRDILNVKLLKEWINYKESVFPRHGIKLWLVLTLELWFTQYLDPPKSAPVLWKPGTGL